ncbi:hypothetical protein [Sulfitobacter sp.]|uniref:hypothetical protein n=1 Tax=Sulfitobacter sp. TaxID=1903071 RepID=UPI0030034F14
MPEVFAWPPVFMTGHERTQDRPVQRSEGLSGAVSLSQSEPTRRLVSADIAGIGKTRDGAAYVEALKMLLDGKPPFVRMTLLPRFWFQALEGQGFRRGAVDTNFLAAGADVDLTANGVGLNLTTGSRIDGVAGHDGWPYLDCTGFAPNKVAVLPTERVTVGDVTATVLRTAHADSGGNARVYLMTALADGEVQIGIEETAVFEILNFPRAKQPLSGNYSYGFELREAFASEYADGFTEVNPWVST